MLGQDYTKSFSKSFILWNPPPQTCKWVLLLFPANRWQDWGPGHLAGLQAKNLNLVLPDTRVRIPTYWALLFFYMMMQDSVVTVRWLLFLSCGQNSRRRNVDAFFWVISPRPSVGFFLVLFCSVADFCLLLFLEFSRCIKTLTSVKTYFCECWPY